MDMVPFTSFRVTKGERQLMQWARGSSAGATDARSSGSARTWRGSREKPGVPLGTIVPDCIAFALVKPCQVRDPSGLIVPALFT